MTVYRDNYPNNIEAPQKLYIQYSHDIEWDYSTGQYPDGEESLWDWESYYIPIDHKINGRTVGRHEWMRIKIGAMKNWSYPIRFAANVTNISSVSAEIVEEDISYTEFKIILTFAGGDTTESEPIRIRNGQDGIGIESCEVREDGYLWVTYTDGTVVNVGRARGQDAEGLPPAQNDDWVLSQSAGSPVWVSPLQVLSNAVSGVAPIEYDFLTGEISHNDDDGNRHIPIGGSPGFILSTNGSGVYSWLDPTELDPTVPSWVKAITATQISNWDTAYSWGDHAGLYANLVHTHIESDITDLDKYTQTEVNSLINNITYQIEVALSQLDTDLTATTGVAKFPCPEDMTIQSCFISVDTAPVGSSAIWDINVESSSIMTDLITIEAGEFSSLTATTQPSFSSTDVEKGEDFVIDCDQVGATTAGQNAVLVITYIKR